MSILPENLSRSSTPDITPTEWKTTIGVVATILTTLFGLDISDSTKATALTIVVSLWVIGQTIGNGIIRHGRATGVFAVEAANAPPVDATPLIPDHDDNDVLLNVPPDPGIQPDPLAEEDPEPVPEETTEIIPPDEGDSPPAGPSLKGK